MKGLLVFDILNYLYEKDVINETQVDITAFIDEIKKNSGDKIELHNTNRLNKALALIDSREYASFDYAKNGTPTHFLEIDTDRVQASLSLAGYDYVVEERRKREIDELNKATKENTIVQKNAAIRMLWFTGVLAVVGVINIFALLIPLLRKPQQSTLQLSPRTEQLLDSMLKSQIKIDSSLELREAKSTSKKK